MHNSNCRKCGSPNFSSAHSCTRCAGSQEVGANGKSAWPAALAGSLILGGLIVLAILAKRAELAGWRPDAGLSFAALALLAPLSPFFYCHLHGSRWLH